MDNKERIAELRKVLEEYCTFPHAAALTLVELGYRKVPEPSPEHNYIIATDPAAPEPAGPSECKCLHNEDRVETIKDLYCKWCPQEQECNEHLTLEEKRVCLACGGFADEILKLRQPEPERKIHNSVTGSDYPVKQRTKGKEVKSLWPDEPSDDNQNS